MLYEFIPRGTTNCAFPHLVQTVGVYRVEVGAVRGVNVCGVFGVCVKAALHVRRTRVSAGDILIRSTRGVCDV